MSPHRLGHRPTGPLIGPPLGSPHPHSRRACPWRTPPAANRSAGPAANRPAGKAPPGALRQLRFTHGEPTAASRRRRVSVRRSPLSGALAHGEPTVGGSTGGKPLAHGEPTVGEPTVGKPTRRAASVGIPPNRRTYRSAHPRMLIAGKIPLLVARRQQAAVSKPPLGRPPSDAPPVGAPHPSPPVASRLRKYARRPRLRRTQSHPGHPWLGQAWLANLGQANLTRVNLGRGQLLPGQPQPRRAYPATSSERSATASCLPNHCPSRRPCDRVQSSARRFRSRCPSYCPSRRSQSSASRVPKRRQTVRRNTLPS